MPFSGMRLSVSLYLQVRECWMVGGLPRREVCLDWTMWGVCGCWFCVSFWAHSPGASFGLRFQYRWGPARWSWSTRTPAYAGSSGLAFAGVGVANWGSRPANEPGMKPGIGSCTRLTWSSLSVFHVSVVYLSSGIFSPVNILIISSGKWRSSNHSSTVCSCGCPPAMLKWLKTKKICTATARVAVPDWSILRSVKEPRFRITPSRADVPLIPEWIVETYFHS